MRARASLILSAVAFTQVALIVVSLALLILQLREARTEVVRLGQEERSLVNQLGEAENSLNRASILLRDYIILDGVRQKQAEDALNQTIARMSRESLQIPEWVSPAMSAQIQDIESTRLEYLARVRTVTSWKDPERKRLGSSYLADELAPMRQRFVDTAREIVTLVRSLGDARNQALADSIDEIRSLVVEILVGAAVLGLALAMTAIWRFRRYEKERDIHVEHLRDAEVGLRALSQQLVEAQELERKKLSRELHDEVGQILTALRVQLGQIEPAGQSRKHLEKASELADRSLRTVREMARDLRPAMLDDLGLSPALKWLCRDFSKDTGLDVDIHIEGELAGLDEARRTCLYRVAQEALTNCLKHSASTSVKVSLQENPGEVVLTVQDYGAGFSPGTSRGVGLLGMKERVEELGGVLTVTSSPGTGTVIRADLPSETLES